MTRKYLIIITALFFAVASAGLFFQYANYLLRDFQVEQMRAQYTWNRVQDANREASEDLPIEQENSQVSLFLAGDVMLSRTVGQKMLKNGYDYPFQEMRQYIESADIAFANLEAPFLDGEAVLTGSFTFRADEQSAPALASAGFDVVSLANNHILNKGQAGLDKTFELLQESNIQGCGAFEKSSGADEIKIIEKNNIKFAFLCYAYGPDYYKYTDLKGGMNLMEQEKLLKDLQVAETMADWVIVSIHDGIEYEHHSSEHQQGFARLAIDNGADMVVGHHPHVVQEVEIYKDKYIFYSLGNFIFDQMWSEATRQGLAVMLRIDKEKVLEVEYLPVIIEDYAQPRPAEGSDKDEVLEFIAINKS